MSELGGMYSFENASDSRESIGERVDRPIDRHVPASPSTVVARLPSFSTSGFGNVTYPAGSSQPAHGNLLEGLIVPLYGTIFLLSVIGNSLVLITLARNKRMRTVTNVYLLNLAVSDLLLGVFCIPFTLIGQMLKNFIFGLTMCKLIPYFQAVSVSVGVWTLVAISLERYFAICRPLKSRRWQTQFHAYKMIAVVWTMSLIWTAPILLVSRLQSIRGGRHKCREEWPNVGTERAYNLFLDGALLLIPLIVMSLAYSLIAMKLWRGLKREIRQTSNCQRQSIERVAAASSARNALYGNGERNTSATVVFNAGGTSSGLRRGFGTTTQSSTASDFQPGHQQQHGQTAAPSRVRVPRERSTTTVLAGKCQGGEATQTSRLPVRSNGNNCHPKDLRNELEQDSPCPLTRQHAIRSNYMGKSIEAKKKVIRMLFAIVLGFFICWAPLHVINTWCLFTPELVYSAVGSTGISLVHLLAYVSSCCNPIIYCFMNKKFRQAFLGLFDCHRCWRVGCRNGDPSIAVTRNAAPVNNSEVSGNDSTIYLGRASLVARSEVVRLLEEEDRV